MPIRSSDYPSASNATEEATANPGEHRQRSDKITVELTVARAYAEDQMLHPDDNALAAIVRNLLNQALRTQ